MAVSHVTVRTVLARDVAAGRGMSAPAMGAVQTYLGSQQRSLSFLSWAEAPAGEAAKANNRSRLAPADRPHPAVAPSR
jgi:hypothetical protein